MLQWPLFQVIVIYLGFSLHFRAPHYVLASHLGGEHEVATGGAGHNQCVEDALADELLHLVLRQGAAVGNRLVERALIAAYGH